MRAQRPRRPAPTILAKLLLAYLAPTVVLFALFGTFAHALARRALEDELGRRLAAIAAATARQIRGQYLLGMTPDEGPRPRAWQNTRRRLEPIVVSTGVARIFVFDRDRRSLCDTRDDVPIGARYHELDLDEHELRSVFGEGRAVSSVLFRGSDGRRYKAGYAPVHASDHDETIVGALRVEAPAAYFGELEALERRLVTYGALLAAAVVLVSIVVAALLTRPLRRLAGAATRIGRGDLAAPVPVRGRDEIGLLAATLDEMREGLRARDERLQMMLAGIAHEVRNPLGGIELYAGILRDELPEGDERRAHVRRIERELGHLGRVVADFLDYARRPRPELAPVPLAPLAREVVELMAADAADAGVALELRAPEAPVVARADAAQLRRALVNLVRNALQATPSGGRVTVELAPAPGGRVRIAVTDTGRGIPPDVVPRVFSPFFTTKEKGIGLGLAFVREIVADHEGTLDVDSRVDRGTTFTIELGEG